MVFQILAYLEAFTFTSIGRSAAMMMVLWLITNILSTVFIKQWMRLRERARGLA
jgi:multiple sugar transport system permease protein